ncbi:hypothetical protein Tco_0039475 [Tanacetum coccineum]
METKVALTKDEEAVDVDVTPKTSHLNAVKRIFKYLKGKPNLGLWYPRESPFDLEAFSDSDYGGSNLDRKSTTGGCQFLGQRLISWQCKKQTIVATSTTEAEYVAAANCCGQVLWVQNQLLDYGFNFMNTKIHIDNESTICIVKNPVYHSKTKHIEIRHHFIRDCYEKKLISVEKIHTDLNVADLLTKPFDGPRFNYLVNSYGFADEGRYALTTNPTIYDSLVKQFWQTATANTLADGTLELQATIDTIVYTITEASIRHEALLAMLQGLRITISTTYTAPIPASTPTPIPEKRPYTYGSTLLEEPSPCNTPTLLTPKKEACPRTDDLDDLLHGRNKFEDIRPTTLEVAKTLSMVASQKLKSIDKGRRYKRRKETKGKKEEASLAEAIRLDTLEKEEKVKQVHLDSLLAQRIAEEEELNEQQKKESSNFNLKLTLHIIEDVGILLEAKIEANAEFVKECAKEVGTTRRRLCKTMASNGSSYDWSRDRIVSTYTDDTAGEGQSAIYMHRWGYYLVVKREANLSNDYRDEECDEAKDDESTKKTGKRRKQIARKGLHSKKTDEDESEASKDTDPISGTNIPVNPVPVAMKPPSIATYKIIKQGEKGVYQIVKEDGTDIVYGMNGSEDELEKNRSNSYLRDILGDILGKDMHYPFTRFVKPARAHDPDYVPEPIYPEYIPLEDDHEFPVEEQPLPPVDSPTAESPGYVTKSDPEEDPEEDDANDKDDEDEEEEEEEHLAPADSAIVVPVDEPTSISLPPEAEVERLLAMTTPSPSPPISLSPSRKDALVMEQALPAHSSPPAALIDAVTAALPSPPLPPLPPSSIQPTTVLPTVDAEERRQGIRDVGYGIRDTWVDPAEAVPEIAPMTVGEVNTRVTELAELHEHDTQDLYALLEDAQDIGLETVWMVEEEAYASREAWAHSIGLSQVTHQELQTHRDHVYAHETHLQAHQTQLQLQGTLIQTQHQAQMVETLRVIRDMRREMSDMQAELLALRGQQRRARQPGPDARSPDHQDASGDADSHI